MTVLRLLIGLAAAPLLLIVACLYVLAFAVAGYIVGAFIGIFVDASTDSLAIIGAVVAGLIGLGQVIPAQA